MKTIEISLTPEEYYEPEELRRVVARAVGVEDAAISHLQVRRRSLDSRRSIKYRATIDVFFQGDNYQGEDYRSEYKDCRGGEAVVIVGAGPSGLFAALHALELGLKPIIVERGKAVDERRKDISKMVRSGEVDEDSNWCFGEGGAGTYSDGKLYTRSTKRGDVGAVLRKFVEHGASPEILIDAHAHIGTDRLPAIVASMRRTIIEHGGEIYFNQRIDDLKESGGRVTGVHCCGGHVVDGRAVLLATGHSARDIFRLMHRRGWQLQPKPFALGVRVEHPQELINEIQYHGKGYSSYLPPASYSLTTQVGGHGVFSFCMCPGGVIVPAATSAGQQVVNGMSNASRSSRYANSGIAVTVSGADVPGYAEHGVLSMLAFQEDVERRVAEASGGNLRAPGQRLTDFCRHRSTGILNRSNYMGQYVHAELDAYLPTFVCESLRQAFKDFDRKMHGFLTEQASLLAVESRTSSPIRIPRQDDGQHPQLKGLFPCGEGAGYAGGIVSSALDGIYQMDNIWRSINE